MSRPVPMRKLEIHVLKLDTDRVLERLGASRCFQLASPPHRASHASGAWAPSLRRLRDIRDSLGLMPPGSMPASVKLPGDDEAGLLATIADIVDDFSAQEVALVTRREQIRDAMSEAKAFEGLKLPFRELDHLSFLSVRIGRIPKLELESLGASLGERALIVPIDSEGTIVAASSKKGRFALDTELKRANFKAKEFPPDFEGLPVELMPSLQSELESLERREIEIAKKKAELRLSYAGVWESLFASYAVAEAIENVKGGLDATDQVFRLEGWVPKEGVKSLVAELERVTEGRAAVRVFSPEELESVKVGTEKVPVLLKRRKFVSSFERLVVSYGAPLYGTIDPTPIVAFFFVLLFSIMFGDVGQGAVILFVGILLNRGSVANLAKFGKFGPIFVAAGMGSMLMGFLVGSVFSNEHFLEPATRALSSALFGKEMDRFLTLMPQSGSMGKLFAFFGFTIGIGVVINSIGLVINMTNKWRLGKKGEALFGKTGLTGAFFFWWAIGIGIRAVLGGSLAWFDAFGLGLPLVGIFFAEQLSHRVDHREEGIAVNAALKAPGEAAATGAAMAASLGDAPGNAPASDDESPDLADQDGQSPRAAPLEVSAAVDKARKEGDGLFADIVKGLVDVLESISYYFSNTLSFLRVGAFALSHTVLSFIVFSMGDLVRTRAPGGIVWEIVIVIIGNAIILVLEGMIVTIQVVRLQYYEFFSKFFTEIGVEFDPFLFEYPKE